ncbi:MAG: glycosyltransferase [Paracoccaceae bacterium]
MGAEGGSGRVVAVAIYGSPLAYVSGSGAYLSAVAQGLKALGCRLHLLMLESSGYGHPAPAVLPRYAAPFETLWASHGPVLSGRAVDLRPGRWFAFAARRAGLLSPPTRIARPVDDPSVRRRALARARAVGADTLMVWRSFPAPLLAEAEGLRRLYLTDDLHILRRQSFEAAGRAAPFHEDIVEAEAAGLVAADACLAIQRLDMALIRDRVPGTPVFLAPHTCPVGSAPLEQPRPPVALFVGAETPPNTEGLAWFLREVWPRVRARLPEARVRVVGAAARRTAEADGVERVGFVEDLGAEYAAATLAIVPLFIGSGLKIKLVEALAAGLPVVATPVGAQGVEDAPAAALTIADDPDGTADAVVARLTSPRAGEERAAARAYAAANFSEAVLRAGLSAALSVPPRA